MLKVNICVISIFFIIFNLRTYRYTINYLYLYLVPIDDGSPSMEFRSCPSTNVLLLTIIGTTLLTQRARNHRH